jgi:hypothetical protein
MYIPELMEKIQLPKDDDDDDEVFQFFIPFEWETLLLYDCYRNVVVSIR